MGRGVFGRGDHHALITIRSDHVGMFVIAEVLQLDRDGQQIVDLGHGEVEGPDQFHRIAGQVSLPGGSGAPLSDRRSGRDPCPGQHAMQVVDGVYVHRQLTAGRHDRRERIGRHNDGSASIGDCSIGGFGAPVGLQQTESTFRLSIDERRDTKSLGRVILQATDRLDLGPKQIGLIGPGRSGPAGSVGIGAARQVSLEAVFLGGRV